MSWIDHPPSLSTTQHSTTQPLQPWRVRCSQSCPRLLPRGGCRHSSPAHPPQGRPLITRGWPFHFAQWQTSGRRGRRSRRRRQAACRLREDERRGEGEKARGREREKERKREVIAFECNEEGIQKILSLFSSPRSLLLSFSPPLRALPRHCPCSILFLIERAAEKGRTVEKRRREGKKAVTHGMGDGMGGNTVVILPLTLSLSPLCLSTSLAPAAGNCTY